MKAPKEIRRYMNKMRKNFGKKNGVIPKAVLDHPEIEHKWVNSKKIKDNYND